MTAHLAIASVTAVLALLLALFFVSISRIPGWRHYRILGAVAVMTALYALPEVFAGDASTGLHRQSTLAASFSLVLALTSATLWLKFDSEQEERRLSLVERAACAALLLGGALCVIPDIMLGPWHSIPSPWLGFTYNMRSTTWVGDLFIGVLLLTMLQLVARYTYRAWHGKGLWLRSLSALLFTLGAVEEGLAATGVLDWPFLGGVLFAVGLVIMGANLGLQVSNDARRLATFNLELEAHIAKRTEDLVTTREALMSTERHVALGQLAAGVGHEVNNPLSYVKGNLDFLREQLLDDPNVPGDDQALAAIADALHGTERIRLVVNNLTTYARSAPVTGAAQVARAVDVAMRVVRPQSKFTMRMNANISETAPVAIDESRLIQILVNLLINASHVSRSVSPPPTITISSWQDHEEVVIEISDRESGMDTSLLERILSSENDSGETQAPHWGIFLCRSLVESAGGSLAVNVRSTSETAIEIRLVSSGEDLPSISDLPPTPKLWTAGSRA